MASKGGNRNRGKQPQRKRPNQAVARRDQRPQPQPAPNPLPLPLDIGQMTVTETKVQSFKGPIPHPDALRHYDAIVPGAADRIIGMAEREQDHRHALVERAVEANIRRDRRGQWMGFVIAVLGLIISGVIIYFGRDYTAAIIGGTVLGGADFVALVALFLRQQRDDNEQTS